jgi:hypothetical protein
MQQPIESYFAFSYVVHIRHLVRAMGVNPGGWGGGGGGGGRFPPVFGVGEDEYLNIPPPQLFDMFNEILFLGYLKT